MTLEKVDSDHLDTVRFRAVIPVGEIGFVSALLEAYEGMGILRTVDKKLGAVEFWISPGFLDTFDDFIRSFGANFFLTPLERIS